MKIMDRARGRMMAAYTDEQVCKAMFHVSYTSGCGMFGMYDGNVIMIPEGVAVEGYHGGDYYLFSEECLDRAIRGERSVAQHASNGFSYIDKYTMSKYYCKETKQFIELSIEAGEFLRAKDIEGWKELLHHYRVEKRR